MGELELDLSAWRKSFAGFELVWRSLVTEQASRDAQAIAAWTARFDDAAGTIARLQAAGQWYSGPTDFMGVLWMGHDEVRNCRVLAWLMRPDGAHGLGLGLLERISSRARRDVVAERPTSSMEVLTETVRGDTRVDILVQTDDAELLIEAKVNAEESPGQTKRYQELWGDEATFVFLTRDGTRPEAYDSKRWVVLRWECVGRLLDEALAEGNPAAPGRQVAEGFRDAVRNHLGPRVAGGQRRVCEEQCSWRCNQEVDEGG
jgi:hypothetical protein